MIDRTRPHALDAIPEADLAEQSVLAYPDDPDLRDELDQDTDTEQDVSRDEWGADPVDVAEQSIDVPLDDEPDEEQAADPVG